MPLSRYDFEVDVSDPGKSGTRQQAAAAELYNQLEAATDWAVLLTFDDLQQRIISRGVARSTERAVRRQAAG